MARSGIVDPDADGTDDAQDNNAIEVLIGRLRRKLGIDLIETRRGFGYLIPDTVE